VQAHGPARYGGGAVATYDAPPAPREERVEMRPGYVWIQGRWDWQGGQWVWMDGRWEAQRSGYQWQQGSWVQGDGGWRYNEGTWIVAQNGEVVGAQTTTSGQVFADHPVTDRYGRPLDQGGGGPMQPPPPAQIENAGSRNGYVWIGGFYQWQNGQYAWVPGHWERERANMVWQAGRWELHGNTYTWVEGQWVTGGVGPRDHR
jgi:WXXGXW repeat (2 copies)